MTPTLDALVRQLREAMAQATQGEWEYIALCTTANLTTLLDALTAAQGIQSAHESLTRAITEAVGDGDPSGPYWEDGVWFLRQLADQAEAEADRLREQVQALHDKADELSAEVSALQGQLAEAQKYAQDVLWLEIREARAERDAAQTENMLLLEARDTANLTADVYQQQRDAAREALRQVEHIEQANGVAWCPWCLGMRGSHAPTCARQAALGQPAETPR